MNRPATVPAAALAILALTVLFAQTAAVRAAAPPNIVFILVDDMGYGDLGCTGAEDIRTPHIDRIAAEGMQLTDFYANAPICTPTREGFMTGRWQQRLGIEFAFGYQVEQKVLVDGEWVPEPGFQALGLPLKAKTLANYLKELDYATGAFGKWHLGYKDVYKYVDDGGTMDLLFDLESDPGEKVNLHYRHPEISADLKARLKAWEAEMDASDYDMQVR